MKKFFHLNAVLLLVFLLSGCVSRQQAESKAQQAYMAGQAQAAKQWQSQQLPEVVVRGPVRNPVVPWTEGLTLAQAIVDADYTGFMNPILVRVIRNGQMIEEMKGIDLLHHHDVPLEAGDIVEIVQ
jgi:PBP1b-binding outer membrane lipoprotein LpoB